MSQISLITASTPITAGVDSITGDSGGALTGALNLVGAAGSGITVAGSGSTLTIDSTPVAVIVYNDTPVANVTGNGTTYQCQFDSTIYDPDGLFASNQFTAPSAGIYTFNVMSNITGSNVNKTDFYTSLNVNGTRYDLYVVNAFTYSTSGILGLSASMDVSLAANDIVYVQIIVFGNDAIDNIGWNGGSSPYTNMLSIHKIR